ncbi:DUF742 domain-containing protein [Saccharomonospora glauca]|jgi:hypothetical protein|uniref:DUF742 domain-containing protein n=1 Tax=Saccharomonospora glauca K62 TaxID=928724 RepID=I1D7Q3_9PSEU|nr:DUF742 domain-containing protein [Saccharomonospora glauca]EIF00978.1 Protein of unknown function (DUF742) [Saccharomonospora glauca K62]
MDEQWYDEAAGPLVRPYTITKGRIPGPELTLDIATQVMALSGAKREGSGLTPEHVAILDLCERPLAIAEIAAHLKVPIAVVKVLCGDLIERGQVIVRSPSRPTQAPDRHLLQAVLDGLTKL